jgi:hypothetical protein
MDSEKNITEKLKNALAKKPRRQALDLLRCFSIQPISQNP